MPNDGIGIIPMRLNRNIKALTMTVSFFLLISQSAGGQNRQLPSPDQQLYRPLVRHSGTTRQLLQDFLDGISVLSQCQGQFTFVRRSNIQSCRPVCSSTILLPRMESFLTRKPFLLIRASSEWFLPGLTSTETSLSPYFFA